MIPPVVGRPLWFVPSVSRYEFGYSFTANKPHAALITAVHSDRLINIVAFDANGKSCGFTSVPLRQPEDRERDEDSDDVDRCEWMPSQIAKAAG